MTRSDVSRWTDEEISTLVSMWPASTTAQIAMRLRRPCGAIREKAKRLCKKGLLDGKNAPRGQSIKPDPQDFD